jgi:capsular exopolysaccharide synthesis family protein
VSRIDEALRLAESGTVATPGVESPRPAPVAPLHQYRPEEPGPDESVQEYRPAEPPPDAAPLPRPAERTQPFRPAASRRRIERGRPDDADLDARLVTSTSSSVSLEQYRRLAAFLHEEQVERQLRTVMITSALPHDGKTLTAVNVALTLSESYARRVLVIDADLRWPSLHVVLRIPNERGLSEALSEERRELPIIQVSPGLSVLTAGSPGPKPLAGLTSRRMAEVLEECAGRFDWVLIDTSPVGVLPDAQVLARLVGAAILVIRAGSTPAAAVERAVAGLGGPDAILGTVLNRVEERRIPDAAYYGQYGTSPDEP